MDKGLAANVNATIMNAPPATDNTSPGNPYFVNSTTTDLPTTDHLNSAKRKRQPKNSACQNCATTKIKCIPGPVDGVCERCHRMNKPCLAAVPKSRRRRTEGEVDSTPRASVPSPVSHGPYPVTASAPRESFHSPYASTPRNNGSMRSLLINADLSHTASPSFKRLLLEGLCLDPSSSAAQTLNECMDYNFVRNQLNVFKQFAATFPFVDLPSTDPVTLVAETPLLVVAISTVTAAGSPNRRHGFGQAFRQALSTKAIVNGERSMDLFLGLMVYLAWHHHYMEKHQIFQELCMLSGMAADLGIHELPVSDSEQNPLELQKHMAFLGCYYLCCGLSSMGFNKPTPLSWSSSLQERALLLHRSRRGPSDVLPLVEVMHAVEDLASVLRNMEARTLASSGFQELQIKVVTQRLRNLKLAFPSLSSLPAFNAVSIHAHQRILRSRNSPDTSILIQSACAIKEYIDDLLTRPPIRLHQIASVEWTNLLEILLLMARISRPPSQSAGWEAGAIASMLQPEALLDSVYAHMAAATVGDPLAPRDDGLLRWFHQMCESIKQRVRFERNGDSAAVSRNNGSHYDAVVAIDREGEDANGRFRAVNEGDGPAPPPPQGKQQVPGRGDFFDLFRHGILDESFWFANGL